MKQFNGGGMLFVSTHKNKARLFFDGLYSNLSNQMYVGTFTIHSTNQFGVFSGGASYQAFKKTLAADTILFYGI